MPKHHKAQHHHGGGAAHHGGGGGAGGGMQAAGNGEPMRQPFIKNTRQRRQTAGAQIAIPAGANTPWTSQPLAQVGMVNRLLMHVRVLLNSGATAFTSPAQPAYKGPWNFLKRISLDLNLGSTNIVQSSGFGLATNNISKKRAFSQFESNGAVGAGTGRDPFFNTGYNGATNIAANKAFAMEWTVVIPVAGNPDDNCTMGLINLQSPEVQLTLSGTYGAVSDLLANASATTTVTGGYMQPYIEYFEIPPPSRRVAMPPLVVHRIAEDTQPILGAGLPFTYQIPRQGKLLRLIAYYDNVGSLVITGSPQLGAATNISPTSPGILDFQVKANKTDSVYFEDYIVRRLTMQELFGLAPTMGASAGPYTANANDSTPMLPQCLGGFLWEFWGASGEPARGNFRDVFDAEALTTLEFITDFDSGLSVNSGAFGGFVREFWQPLSAGVARGLMGR